MDLQNHIALLLANPTEVRCGEGDDNLWSQFSPKSAEKGLKPLPLCLSLLMLCSGKVSTSRFVDDDGSNCKSSIPLVARYPARQENGMVLCILKDVPDNILNVGQLGCIVREHLGSTSWTHSILHLVLFGSFESCNTQCVQMCPYTHDGLGNDME